MKKTRTKQRKSTGDASIARILSYYEHQSEEDAVREIETAREVYDSMWMLVPAELVPQIRRLIARRKKTA